MAADHLEFLKERFIREFHEAEEEFGGEFPLLPQFHDIQNFLQRRSINPFTPIVMKNGLYDLIHELKECIMLAEKERDRQKERNQRIQNMKSRFHVHTHEIQTRIMMTMTNVKKCWFIYTTRKKLLRIKRNLELVKDDDAAAEAAAAESSLLSNYVEVWSSWNSSWHSSRIRRQAARGTHGFDDELKKIKTLLLRPANDGIKTIGIVGMSGVGKTTLARMVINDPDCRRLFSPVIWVTHSQNLSDPSDLMRQLLETFSAHDNDAHIIIPDSLPEQLRELQNRLWGKKYLIVLDKVWHQKDWYSDLRTDGTICMNRLCHGLPKGGGLIVTSGLEEVATSMVGEHDLFRLQPLFNQEEALWSIFMDLIRRKKFLTYDHHQRLERMKDEIIYRCDGLPLAAKTLAEIISTQIGKEKYWSITNVTKKFRLRLDPFDGISYDEAIKKVRNLGGVEDVSSDLVAGEITIIGRCLPVEIARELGKLLHTELISVRDISERYMLLKLDLHNKKDEKKAMKIVSNISGIASISMDMNEKNLLVFGNVDPEEVVSKLRKYWHTDIILLGPVKQPLPVKRHLQEKRLGKERRLHRLKNQLTDFQNGVVLSGPKS